MSLLHKPVRSKTLHTAKAGGPQTGSRGATGLVSIVIPTYKRPKEARRAVESALAQTWSEVEVLVVADGPDPQTRALLDGLDERLRYIELPHQAGPAAARNAGVAAGRGEWLAFLDDDDLMVPTRIEAQMKAADPSRPWRMLACRMNYHSGERHDLWPERPIGPGEDIADYILRRPSLLRRPGIVPLQTLLVHRSVWEKVQFCTHNDHEDWAWLLQAWHLAGARVEFVWEPLVTYTVAVKGTSRSGRTNWQDSLAWAQDHRAWIGRRAFCSFLATKAAMKAKRAGDWHGLRAIAKEVVMAHPAALDLLFLLGIALLPGPLLHRAWKRSLRSGESGAARPEANHAQLA